MARMPRVVVPGVPLHVSQRCADHRSQLFDPQDYAGFLVDLSEAAANCGCAVHAYALMPSRWDLLLTPADAGGPLPLIRVLGLRYLRRVARRRARGGTFRESRLRSTALQSDRRFLACSRRIEMSPVRAWLVSDPAAYPWSSFRCNALGARDAIVTPHPLYRSLGATAAARQTAYRSLFEGRLDADVIEPIGWGAHPGAVIVPGDQPSRGTRARSITASGTIARAGMPVSC